jgi:serine O-acetyltransferase
MVVDYCVQVVTKSEVRVATELAPGVYLSDRGYVVLGASVVGRGTVIHHRVTIGWSMKGSGTPEIGERVWIGPDTVVVGDIRIGDGVTILPGTVLTRSIPSNTLVQGNPARIVRRDFDNTELRRTLATEAGAP